MAAAVSASTATVSTLFGLRLARWHAPGHSRLAIDGKIAKYDVDQKPLLQHSIDGRGDFFLEIGQAGVGQMFGIGGLHKPDDGIAGPFLVLWPAGEQPRIAILRQNAIQVKLDVEQALVAAERVDYAKPAEVALDEILGIDVLPLLEHGQQLAGIELLRRLLGLAAAGREGQGQSHGDEAGPVKRLGHGK